VHLTVSILAPNQLLITPVNNPPVADAGLGQTVHPGTPVTLDGSGSFDPDGNVPLSFSWTITSAPAGSVATLSDAGTITPTFTPDLLGDYAISLVVTDSLGASSAPNEVLISTFNTAPVADAGPDQAILQLGTTVQLGQSVGRQSFDDNGDPITFSWTLTVRPTASSAFLNVPSSATPTFVADVQGTYVITLVVTDIFGAASASTPLPPLATVTVSFDNVKPVADAGDTQSVAVGQTVSLNGNGSSDANLDPLTFSWSIVSAPTGSSAQLINPTSAQTTFVADVAGMYVVSLVVNDGLVNSDPSSVTITATATQDDVIQALRDAIDAINGLADTDFKNIKRRKTLANKINVVIKMVDQGLFQDALDKLQNDILAKTDGCLGGHDGNDWITNCDAQAQVSVHLLIAIALLSAG